MNAETPWKVKTITGYAGGHGDKSEARATIQIDTQANTVEEIRALAQAAPALLQALAAIEGPFEMLCNCGDEDDAAMQAIHAQAVAAIALATGGDK